ncbi:MAG: glycosyl hydrolase, partial [Betaproteobacteria bacterium]
RNQSVPCVIPGCAGYVAGSVVEFYNKTLDNFFITAEPAEQLAVAGGAAGPGWAVTGNVFRAGGPAQVCRFYGSISPGPNSHFYTIDPQECQALKTLQANTPATQKRWNFESNDFSGSIPVAGQCADGLVPVYRAYNNGFTRGIDSNHRITANHDAYLAQIDNGWAGEGIVMCAPAAG